MRNTIPDERQTRARVVELIRRGAKLLDPDEELPGDRELMELGMDSFGLLELITDLELEFDILIPDEMLTRETFRSASSVTRAVRDLLAGAEESAR